MLFRKRTAKSNDATQSKEVSSKKGKGTEADKASDSLAVGEPGSVVTSKLFNGRIDQQLELAPDVLRAPFTLDLKLTSSSPPKEPAPFGRTTPQMPLADAGNVGVYLTDQGYFVLIKTPSGEPIIRTTVGDAHVSTRLTLVSDSSGTVLFVDGTEAARSPQSTVMAARLRVGAGQLDRFWSGAIEFLDVFIAAKVKGSFSGQSPRFGLGDRVASLD